MPIVCKNCSHEFEGKFCPQCGQKAKIKRITTKQVFNEARERLFHYDHGFFYTMRELMIRPGHSVREYVEGKRARHLKPLKFLFWAAAINFLIFHYSGLDQELMQKLSDQQQNNHPLGQQLSQKLFQTLTNHPALMLFSMIPFIAFWSRLLFRRKDYNYAEHFVLNAFLMGELSMASVVTAPISKYLSSISTTAWPMTFFSIGIWVIYFGWAYSQFMLQNKKIGAWLKGGLAVFLGYLVMIMFISILTALAVIFFKPQLEAWIMN